MSAREFAASAIQRHGDALVALSHFVHAHPELGYVEFESSAAVANPAIQSNLGASLAGIQWVTNGYLLALAVTLITIGKIGDRFGHKKVFLTGIVGFAATSAAIA